MAVSHAIMTAVVEAYVAAFAAGDAEAAAALFAAEATIEDPVGTPVLSGEMIPALFHNAMGRGLKLERTGPIRTAGDSAAFPFRIHYPETAERLCIDVIDTFRFDDQGRIIQMRAFWGPDNIQLRESLSHA